MNHIEMYKRGVKVADILAECGIGPQRFYRDLAAEGLSRAPRPSQGWHSGEDPVSLYREGAPIAEIKVRCLCSTQTVYAELKRHGVPLRGGPVRRWDRKAIVAEYLRGDLSLIDLAKKHGLSRQAVTRMVDQAKAPRRQRGGQRNARIVARVEAAWLLGWSEMRSAADVQLKPESVHRIRGQIIERHYR